MAQNIEIKVRVEDLDAVRVRAQAVADEGPFLLEQTDYFFPASCGRLKLRVEESGAPNAQRQSRLIAYHRPDQATARSSDYVLYETDDPETLRDALLHSLGEGPVVRKRRELYLSGQTRIHLDRVEMLGAFVEIEVVMQDGESEDDGHVELQHLLTQLGLETASVIDVAYADLLSRACSNG